MNSDDYQLSGPRGNNHGTYTSWNNHTVVGECIGGNQLIYLQNYPYSTLPLSRTTGKFQKTRYHLDDSQMYIDIEFRKKILRYCPSEKDNFQKHVSGKFHQSLSKQIRSKSNSINSLNIKPLKQYPKFVNKVKGKVNQLQVKRKRKIKPPFVNKWGSETDSEYSLFDF